MNSENSENVDIAVLASELRAQLSKLRRRLREQSFSYNLSSSQIAVLLRLDTVGEATVSELSRMEGVRPQSMRNTVQALKQLGYIDGQADPNDGRKTYIHLSEEGKNYLSGGRAVWNDWLAKAISERLTESEQAVLNDSVVLLKRITEY